MADFLLGMLILGLLVLFCDAIDHARKLADEERIQALGEERLRKDYP